MEYSFVIEGPPKPKERPRTTKTGHTFTPPATRKAQERVAAAYDGPMFKGPVHLFLHFEANHTEVTITDAVWDSPLRGDIDNYQKLVQDALQGLAYANDRQVVRVEAEKG